ncbi:hypothetical protein WN943_028803 [Citrus x changshan-huyou]
MAGGNHPKSSSHKPPPSALSSYRKSRWESPKNPPSDQKPKPSPNKHSPAQPKSLPAPTHPSFSSHGPPLPYSEPPPPPPAYGFHMLERRTIVLADGSVRSYFALPPDYDFTPRHNSLLRPEFHFSPEAAGFRDRREYINGPGPMKRKFGVDEEKELQHLMSRANSSRDRLVGTSGHFDEETRAAKYMRTTPGAVGPSVVKHKYDEVDHAMLKKVFLHFVKVINENVALRKSYLVEDGKQGRLQCIACRRKIVLFFLLSVLKDLNDTELSVCGLQSVGLKEDMCRALYLGHDLFGDD